MPFPFLLTCKSRNTEDKCNVFILNPSTMICSTPTSSLCFLTELRQSVESRLMVEPDDSDFPIYLLVHTAMRRPVMDEDSNDVDVPSPGSQVERGAAFAVSHVS